LDSRRYFRAAAKVPCKRPAMWRKSKSKPAVIERPTRSLYHVDARRCKHVASQKREDVQTSPTSAQRSESSGFAAREAAFANATSPNHVLLNSDRRRFHLRNINGRCVFTYENAHRAIFRRSRVFCCRSSCFRQSFQEQDHHGH
jgi:hypothetical protein